MRLNQYIALHTGISRRKADELIQDGSVLVNGQTATLGQLVSGSDKVFIHGKQIKSSVTYTTIMLNKPVGYVCSRDGQGSKTIYDLLPQEFHNLKPVGRLDKDSSGLILLTNDGELANKLTHPSYQKQKVYEVELDKPLTLDDKTKIEQGIMLEDGISKFRISKIENRKSRVAVSELRVTIAEGRNRQIRRTFAALGYKVTKLHRTQFGKFSLGNLKNASYRLISGWSQDPPSQFF